MFPEPEKPVSTKRMPDFEYIRKELLRNGVNKRLLWDEYFEQCRREGADALMYSQFCYYIQQDEAKRRATMHIPRKPGQQIEVDWAGDTASVIDRDTGEFIKVYVFVAAMSYSTYAYVFFLGNSLKFYDNADEGRAVPHLLCIISSYMLLLYSSSSIHLRRPYIGHVHSMLSSAEVPSEPASSSFYQEIL